jgi:hypothetical protein
VFSIDAFIVHFWRRLKYIDKAAKPCGLVRHVDKLHRNGNGRPRAAPPAIGSFHLGCHGCVVLALLEALMALPFSEGESWPLEPAGPQWR